MRALSVEEVVCVSGGEWNNYDNPTKPPEKQPDWDDNPGSVTACWGAFGAGVVACFRSDTDSEQVGVGFGTNGLTVDTGNASGGVSVQQAPTAQKQQGPVPLQNNFNLMIWTNNGSVKDQIDFYSQYFPR